MNCRQRFNAWAWLGYAFSHHPPSQAHRTLWIPLPRGKGLRLCARCTGHMVGFMLAVALKSELRYIPAFWLALLACALPLTTIVDWTTQALGKRESNNLLRLLTGALFILGGACLPPLATTASPLVLAVVIVLLSTEATGALLLLHSTGTDTRLVKDLEHEIDGILSTTAVDEHPTKELCRLKTNKELHH